MQRGAWSEKYSENSKTVEEIENSLGFVKRGLPHTGQIWTVRWLRRFRSSHYETPHSHKIKFKGLENEGAWHDKEGGCTGLERGIKGLLVSKKTFLQIYHSIFLLSSISKIYFTDKQ